MWHRNRWRVWFPTEERGMALVLAIALLNPIWSCQTLSFRGSSFCVGIPSWIKLLLITWCIFPPVPYQSHIIPSMLIWLVPAQDIHFFYTRSHFSALQSCAIIFSKHFQSIFTFKWCTTQFSHWIVSFTINNPFSNGYLVNLRTVLWLWNYWLFQ